MQPPARVLIGGVGYRWLRDGSFGLFASDTLAREPWPEHVTVLDMGYGALYATLDIRDAQPAYERVILIAGVVRDREPGLLYLRRWKPRPLSDEEVQACIYEAGAGVVDIDLLLIIAQYFGALPNDVLCVEFEPVEYSGGDTLSEPARQQLAPALALVRSYALGHQSAEALGAVDTTVHAVRATAGSLTLRESALL